MKILKSILTMSIAMIMLSSCYEEEFFVDDATTTEGKHFPVIQGVSYAETPVEGATINLIMLYWSEDPIDHLELYATVAGTETLYSSVDYTYNYVEETQSEMASLPYAIPNGTSGTNITLRVVVVNENELTRERTVTVAVQ